MLTRMSTHPEYSAPLLQVGSAFLGNALFLPVAHLVRALPKSGQQTQHQLLLDKQAHHSTPHSLLPVCSWQLLRFGVPCSRWSSDTHLELVQEEIQIFKKLQNGRSVEAAYAIDTHLSKAKSLSAMRRKGWLGRPCCSTRASRA